MTMTNLNIRIDDDLKNQAKVILDGYGISPSQAVKMLFLEVKMLFLELVATCKFPLSLSYQADYQPNAKTISAMHELDNGGGTLYANLDEFLAEHGDVANQA
ncbi:type II toxin-antitoxin system RelB/DinJ family antitoxin [Moraxella catarrhalis]|uniref:type II toxin-antitoxin system RelB/DinJ family antitoxin n=1 Tax=Moraxella catarrhalis TaxID=480 RepID=UPI00128E2119|nr:type II toxin-antitoxin system RelB/DinJ family antitoxin [Moraxella catarrhalis]MPX87469.1 type II toxin-antitoxin system antitoxin, RelB/DinJ family [Moraxella catarrhalis]